MYFTIIALALITAFFLSWYFRHKSRERERMMLIEKGYNPADLPDEEVMNISWMKIGIVSGVGAIGLILTGFFFIELDIFRNIVPFLALVFFVGIGLGIANKIDKSND